MQYPLDALQIIMGAVLTYVAWSLKTTVREFKQSITDLYEKYDSLNADFNRLKGEHDARTEGGKCK